MYIKMHDTRMDHIRNEVIRSKVGVASIEDKVHEDRLRWYGHVQRRSLEAPVWGRPRITWTEVVRKYILDLGIQESLISNRVGWKSKIHIADPN